ncbi:hypothetical protein LCGC14_0533980 [marine sediment metagenome]|uniref:Phytanoyl-CoA dioxygenase n=1 Tax=marine sediment metagenome TaxID=412755 RepID=A0A0F9RZA3_9ZZZZ
MTTLLFNTMKPKVVGHVDINPNRLASWHDGHFDTIDEIIEREPQFHQATPDYIEMINHGCLTHMILEQLREIIRGRRQHTFNTANDYHYLQIDVEVHRLKPGWYPCIPGWHCNFITRDEKENIQPDRKKDEKTRHWMVVLGENITPTQFLRTRNVTIKPKKSPQWNVVNEKINKLIEAEKVEPFQVTPGDIIMFRGNELYRGLAAENRCWRYLFRASLFPKNHLCHRPNGTHGEIRTQQQVFLDVSS